MIVPREQQEGLKQRVRAYWEREPCGTREGVGLESPQRFAEMERFRYSVEPYIHDFAGFARSQGKMVLEIGVGAGTDFGQWLQNGVDATGVDLSATSVRMTNERLQLQASVRRIHKLLVADAEYLPWRGGQFDLVYSWGVLHHTPDTEAAFREVARVLRPGGELRGMIYHVPSWTGWMVWARHSLAAGQPRQSIRRAIFEHLESPGTKAFGMQEARRMLALAGFAEVSLSTRLGAGDLLAGHPSYKYQHPIYRFIWRMYPRWLLRRIGDRFGIYLLITARKATD